ncbi:MAG: phytoene desaturase family protein, partial [Candidatus Thorarchaeota archaeon]
YMAKAGMKVLILEKNANPGGYCTSFKRGEFHFDACVHSLGSLRKDGNIRLVLRELDLEKRLNVERYDPSDIIITPDFEINFWNLLEKVIQEFQIHFMAEAKRINNFFHYINECQSLELISLRSTTFQGLINKHFKNEKLKSILSFPVLGNTGCSPSEVSALTGVLMYKEFIFDGGYYPAGTIQALPNIFTERFKEFGGEIYLSSTVKRINVKNKKIESVETEKNGLFSCKYVVSNADVMQTFFTLIGKDKVTRNMIDKLNSLSPSLSMFIIYLGIKEKAFNDFISPNTNVWFLPDYDIDKMYNLALKGDIDNLDCFLIRLLPDCKSMLLLTFAPFISEEYWIINKKRLIEIFIKKAERILPNLSSSILFKDAATPNTLYKWTRNYKGASYGWAGIPSQIAIAGLTQRTEFANLFLTGHWTTLVQGVAGVAYLGRDTAKRILKKESIQ